MLPLLLTLLQDQVNAVRMAATGVLGALGSPACLGLPWMRAKVLPHLTSLFHTEGGSYLQRITVLYALRELLLGGQSQSQSQSQQQPAPGTDVTGAGSSDGSGSTAEEAAAHVAPDALPLLLGGLRDEVPNVRFVAVQIVEEAGHVLSLAKQQGGSSGKEALAPLVGELAGKDTDADVRYFAQRALAKLR